jgi:hypothetical protein
MSYRTAIISPPVRGRRNKALIGHECQRAEAEIRASAKVRGWESWKILVSAKRINPSVEKVEASSTSTMPRLPRHALTNFRP